jgi:predicted transcriptional regulator
MKVSARSAVSGTPAGEVEGGRRPMAGLRMVGGGHAVWGGARGPVNASFRAPDPGFSPLPADPSIPEPFERVEDVGCTDPDAMIGYHIVATIYLRMARVKTTIYLEDADYRRLKRIAERERTSAAELIRAAVSAFVAQEEPSGLPAWVGLVDAEPGLSVCDEDELLEGFGES